MRYAWVLLDADGTLFDYDHSEIVTNGLAEVQQPRLAAAAIGPHIAGIVISEEVGSAKPDGGIFRAAFEAMGGRRSGTS